MKLLISHFEGKIDELSDVMNQHFTRLEHGARQPRLATEADGQQADTRTRESTEGAATAAQAMRGDCFSARRVEPGPTTNSTSFGVKAEPPALPYRDDVVVESGLAAPKPCLPFKEMRSTSAAGGLLPTGEAFSATRTILNKPPLRYYSTEETDSKTNWRNRVRYVSYDSNFLPAAYSFRMVIETKSGENRMFDPGGSQGRLRTCPFLESRRMCFVMVKLFVLEQLGEAVALF